MENHYISYSELDDSQPSTVFTGDKQDKPIFDVAVYQGILCWKHPPRQVYHIIRNITIARIKITIILIFLLAAALAFALSNEENEESLHLRGVSVRHALVIGIEEDNTNDVLEAICAFQDLDTRHDPEEPPEIFIQVQGSHNEESWHVVDGVWIITLEEEELSEMIHDFFLENSEPYEYYRFYISTNSNTPLGITFRYRSLFNVVKYEVIIAALILAGVYVLIVFELMHRTISALLGSFVCLGVLTIVHGRPSFEEVISWIDFETVGLLFGMMVMVGIFSETGFFEWAAIKAYRLSRGNIWHLTVILCLFTAGLSAFLDNVTTILLMSPVTIRLCKVLDIEPQPILLALVMLSNIGGTATVIGDPPNIIIVSDPDIAAHGDITFTSFSFHVAPGVFLAAFGVFAVIYFFHKRSMTRTPHVGKQREIDVWKQSLRKVTGEDDDERRVREQLQEYIFHLESEMKAIDTSQPATLPDVSELERQYVIKDIPLFISSVLVLGGVIAMFFLHSWIGDYVELSLAWIAIIGAMIHLLVSGIHDIEEVLEKVELGTLLFFAGLFVLMHGLDLLGLIDWIGEQIYALIVKLPEGNTRLACAIILIIWVSAFASAFIDNIPYTTAMVPVVVSLAESDLGLPLAPLTWALAYGTCFGGNGTLIGASANVVAVGLLEQQGYPISFVRFFKTGFPCMIVSVTIATVYLLITHVLIPWY